MKRSLPKIAVLMMVLFCYNPTGLYSQFTLGAEVRPRAEYRHGFKKLIDTENQDAALFIEQRTRLTTFFKKDKMEFKLSLQDVRIWGAEAQIYKPYGGAGNSFSSANEAWGKYNFSKKWAVKVGRQELDYDNARFLGNLAWAQQSRSHDALLVTLKDSTSMLHMGAAFNQDGNTPEFAKLLGTFYDQAGNYKSMQFLWYHKDFKQGSLSALFFNNGVQARDTAGVAKTYFSQTVGWYGKFNLAKSLLETEAYYQFGKDGTGRSLSGYLVGLGLTSPISGKVSVTIGADYVSGTAITATNNNSFTPFYGTNHKFYGLMDYFYVGNPAAQMGKAIGLFDPYLKFKIGLGKKAALLAHVHEFISPVKIYQNPELQAGSVSSVLGTEIDVVFNLNISKEVNLKVGYSQLFATESMAIIKGGNSGNLQNWAWAMFTFKPTLLEQ